MIDNIAIEKTPTFNKSWCDNCYETKRCKTLIDSNGDVLTICRQCYEELSK